MQSSRTDDSSLRVSGPITATVVGLALSLSAIFGQAIEEAPARLVKPLSSGLAGEAAPLEKVLAAFLVRAYRERHAPTWVEFVDRFGIDPSWPSAELLGRVAYEIETEQRDRAALAGCDIGLDPSAARSADDWRDEESGRRFAEVLGALIADGFDVPILKFVQTIEVNIRPHTTFYSDLAGPTSARESELFWRGAESIRPGLRGELGR